MTITGSVPRSPQLTRLLEAADAGAADPAAVEQGLADATAAAVAWQRRDGVERRLRRRARQAIRPGRPAARLRRPAVPVPARRPGRRRRRAVGARRPGLPRRGRSTVLHPRDRLRPRPGRRADHPVQERAGRPGQRPARRRVPGRALTRPGDARRIQLLPRYRRLPGRRRGRAGARIPRDHRRGPDLAGRRPGPDAAVPRLVPGHVRREVPGPRPAARRAPQPGAGRASTRGRSGCTSAAGDYPGPHHRDLPLAVIIDILHSVHAGTLVLAGASPQHRADSADVRHPQAASRDKPGRWRHRHHGPRRRGPVAIADAIVAIAGITGPDRILAAHRLRLRRLPRRARPAARIAELKSPGPQGRRRHGHAAAMAHRRQRGGGLTWHRAGPARRSARPASPRTRTPRRHGAPGTPSPPGRPAVPRTRRRNADA